jgi:hypothetical protein
MEDQCLTEEEFLYSIELEGAAMARETVDLNDSFVRFKYSRSDNPWETEETRDRWLKGFLRARLVDSMRRHKIPPLSWQKEGF